MVEATDHPRGIDVHLRSAPQIREYEAIVGRIAADRPGAILDWGCGFGQVSSLLLAHGLDVTSMEFDPEVDGVVTRPLERYPEIEATMTPEPVVLPFSDGCFDAVLSMGVLEHVEDPEGSLAELRRVLRRGGRLYVYKLPNRRSYLELVARIGGLYYHGAYPHDRVYTRSSARALLESARFTVAELRLANMLPLGLTAGPIARRDASWWRLNVALARVPGLRALATNVEVVAVRGG